MKEVGLFIIKEYVPIALALGVLYPDYDNADNQSGSPAYGAGLGRFLAWGAFPASDDTMRTGVARPVGRLHGRQRRHGDDFTVANKARRRVEVPRRRQLGSDQPHRGHRELALPDLLWRLRRLRHRCPRHRAYPGDVSRTQPKRSNGYSYIKAPRWNGKSCEVGPMARMYVNGLFVEGRRLPRPRSPCYTAYVKTAGGSPVSTLR